MARVTQEEESKQGQFNYLTLQSQSPSLPSELLSESENSNGRLTQCVG